MGVDQAPYIRDYEGIILLIMNGLFCLSVLEKRLRLYI
jgi:hypothetical protein